MEELKRKVVEHDRSIDKLTIAVESLATSSKESNNKLSDIAKSMSKQELILEKISNMEDKSKDTVARIHKRMDDIEKHSEEKLDLKLKPLDEDVKQLKSDRIWITRVVIGKVILLGMAAIFYIKG